MEDILEYDTDDIYYRFNSALPFNHSIDDLDLSQFNFTQPIWIVRPLWEVVLKTVVFLPVIIGGIIGNLTLVVIVVNYKKLQTPTNILIASMALTDLTNLIICPWMMLVRHFYQNYILGMVGCKMEGFLSASFLVTGVLLLSVVSYDRLTAIVLPRETRLTKNGSIIVSFVCVIIGIVIGMPLFIFRYYKERQWKNFLEKYCKEDIKILPIYWHVLLSTLVWFPMVVMTICYTTIFWKLGKYQQQILRREHPLSVNHKTRVARTMFIIVLIFIGCRLPFTVLVFWRNYMVKQATPNSVTSSFNTLWFMAHYLIYFNCAINPIIYGLTNENYKRVLSSTPLYKKLNGDKKKNHIKGNENEVLKPEVKKKCCLCCCKTKRVNNSELNIQVISNLQQMNMESPNLFVS